MNTRYVLKVPLVSSCCSSMTTGLEEGPLRAWFQTLPGGKKSRLHDEFSSLGLLDRNSCGPPPTILWKPNSRRQNLETTRSGYYDGGAGGCSPFPVALRAQRAATVDPVKAPRGSSGRYQNICRTSEWASPIARLDSDS
jgi:hypothetical protein